jgi:hypothetical protein
MIKYLEMKFSFSKASEIIQSVDNQHQLKNLEILLTRSF